MHINVGNHTWKIDLGFAIFLLGLYISIDLYSIYACLSHVIRTAFDQARRPGERRPARMIYLFLSELRHAHTPTQS